MYVLANSNGYNSMDEVSVIATQIATVKTRKIHRTRPDIARKVIAFRELINLEKGKKTV